MDVAVVDRAVGVVDIRVVVDLYVLRVLQRASTRASTTGEKSRLTPGRDLSNIFYDRECPDRVELLNIDDNEQGITPSVKGRDSGLIETSSRRALTSRS